MTNILKRIFYHIDIKRFANYSTNAIRVVLNLSLKFSQIDYQKAYHDNLKRAEEAYVDKITKYV